MAENFYSNCRICASNDLKDLYCINNFQICSCNKCDFVFVKNILSENELDYFYSDDQSDDPNDPIYAEKDNNDNLNYYYEKTQSLILNNFNTGTLLDIGCNRGQFLEIMSNDFSVFGVERAKASYLIAKEKFGNRIFTGTLRNYPKSKAKFDVITLMDVFDHLINPKEELNNIYKILKPEGMVIIKIHNINCLLSKITGKNFYALLPPFHLSYFGPKNIKKLLIETGFQRVQVKFIGNRLSIRTIFYRLARRKKEGFFYIMFKIFSLPFLRKVSIVKNLRDIMTIVAFKK